MNETYACKAKLSNKFLVIAHNPFNTDVVSSEDAPGKILSNPILINPCRRSVVPFCFVKVSFNA